MTAYVAARKSLAVSVRPAMSGISGGRLSGTSREPNLDWAHRSGDCALELALVRKSGPVAQGRGHGIKLPPADRTEDYGA